jgi:uncharacterized Tic20 family protein
MEEAKMDDPNAMPVGGVSPEADKDARTMAMLCHLLAIFTGFIGPLVIWLIKKDQYAFVDDQGKEALNFQITMLIAHIVAGLLWCVVVGMAITPILLLMNIIFCIMGTVKANNGNAIGTRLTFG